MRVSTLGLGTLLAAACLWMPVALALDAPKAKVVLTINGKIAVKNHDAGVQLDMAMLAKLPQKTFSTYTPWTNTSTEFSGPLLRDVLALAKASGTKIKAVATNDYETSIPLSDAMTYNMILATKMDGQPIPTKTKGPLFIVYPYDSKPELSTSVYYNRSPWQVRTLTIE